MVFSYEFQFFITSSENFRRWKTFNFLLKGTIFSDLYIVQQFAQHRPTTLEVGEIVCSGLNGLCIIYCTVYLKCLIEYRRLSNQFTSIAELTRSLDLRDIV